MANNHMKSGTNAMPSKKNSARKVPGAQYQNTKGQFKGSAPKGKPQAKIDL